ncbi:MAG: ornithine carbamoyltransferase [Candidatus Aminicenantes bacterium]|nr:ornithine carbamoyltransferase [Candidatus Aminicenantes bacterium]
MFENFLSVHDISPYDFTHTMDLSIQIKKNPKHYRTALRNKILAMIFQKPSLRTRMTFEVGMLQLGGSAVYLGPSDIQMGKRETPYDIGKNLERWVDGIMIRTFEHQNVIDLAESTKIPVINALTDLLHPCQALADFLTLKEKKGDLSGLTLAWLGDGNNVCHSLLYTAAKTGTKMRIATPQGYEPKSNIVKQAEEDGKESGSEFVFTNDPSEAAKGADAVYTDTWASMGQENEREERKKIFAPFQVNENLMAQASPGAFFMHCLPAHRGEEVTDAVIDSPASLVYEQAENRLHVQKAILVLLLGK